MTKQEMLIIARVKAENLPLGCQIRVTAELDSYTLFNFENIIYIGWPIDSKLGKFFKNRPVYDMINGNGIVIYHTQRFK